eukprot:TRINITY_DN1826_c0_g1_i1.p1 TRINITY_DN1826_c0_g1~~TRINITY_DN1826_c0_g1_i1.p1  ORF type:complete len:197 (-),score=26.61 TRINITY_DN1826_c0_g1_i1:37-627(-)
MKSILFVAIFVVSSVAQSGFVAQVVRPGIICRAALPTYMNHTQTNSSLSLSDVELASNSPVLLYEGNGAITAVTYTSGLGLLADIGVKPLEGLSASDFTNYYTWTELIQSVTVGHTYLLTSVKPTTSTTTMAFTVDSIDEGDVLNIRYGVMYHQVHTRLGRDTTNIEVGDMWTVLADPSSPSDCTWQTLSAVCKQN